MNIKRKFVSLGASLALALSLLGIVAQPVLGLTCPDTGETQVWGSGSQTWAVFYESENYNVGAPADKSKVLCIVSDASGPTSAQSAPDFKNIPVFSHITGICDGQFATSYQTWNDCASSAKFLSDCHHNWGIWKDASFAGSNIQGTTSHNYSVLPYPMNNSISSYRLTYHSICQSSPTP